MTSVQTDVVVVGAGPAGSAAAFHLASGGARVVLLDRCEFPRAKVCGDGLTPRALAQIDAICPREALGAPRALTRLVTVDLTDGSTQRGPVPGLVPGRTEAAVVPRVVLDDALRAAAVRAGARFFASTDGRDVIRGVSRVAGVCAARRGEELSIEAAVTLVAGGATNRLGRRLGARRALPPAGFAVRQYFALLESLEAAFRIYVPISVGDRPACGYGWVFPVDARLANVGVGCFLGEVAPGDVVAAFQDFVAALSRVEPVFRGASRRGVLEGGWIPCGLDVHAVEVPGALLVGDAARAANPFTGEGIAQALESGRAAAAAALAHLDGGRDLAAGYAERLAVSFPGTRGWPEALPWLAERGGRRSREFWQVVNGPVGLVGRASRTLALEEGERGRRGRYEAEWTRVTAQLASRHPLLARLVDAIVDDVAMPAEDPLAADETTWRTHDLPLPLLVLLAVLARDVNDADVDASGQPLTARTIWAKNTVALGAADVLVAECFAALAALPGDEARRFAAAAAEFFSIRLTREVAARRESPRRGLSADLLELVNAFGAPPGERTDVGDVAHA